MAQEATILEQFFLYLSTFMAYSGGSWRELEPQMYYDVYRSIDFKPALLMNKIVFILAK
jgi:hypothetical protein